MIVLDGVSKVYGSGESSVWALRDVDVRIGSGELVTVHGPAGSGKSTLLNIIGGLEQPSAGHCLVEGREISGLDDEHLAETRNRHLGFMFQAVDLVPHLSVMENVALTLDYGGRRGSGGRRARALSALSAVGLEDRASERAAALRDGERRRAALARAVVNAPEVVLVDDPLAGIDPPSGRIILEVLTGLHRRGTTVVITTQDGALARRGTRALRMRDGGVVTDRPGRRRPSVVQEHTPGVLPA